MALDSASYPPGRRVAVLFSGGGTLLQSLLDGSVDPDSPYEVVLALADRPDAGGLDRAREYDVPTAVHSIREFANRDAWNVSLKECLDVYRPDLIVSAGFMKIIGEPLLGAYDGRILNTHPTLLPAFPGAHGVRDALAYGVQLTGASVIIVDAGTDTGPIVAQQAVEVRGDDCEESLHERIKVVERQLIVDVVSRMTQHGWRIEGRRVHLSS